MESGQTGKPGNLMIIGDTGNVGGAKPDTPKEKDKEEVFTDDEAKIIIHFFEEDLLEINMKGIIRREPDRGPPKRLVISYTEKRSEKVEKLLDHLKSKVRDLSQKDVNIPQDKKKELADFDREFKDNSDVLLLTDIASDNVKIVGKSQDEVDTIAHKLKLKTGLISATSGRVNRQVSDPSGSSPSYASIVADGAGKRLYPDLDSLKKSSSYDKSNKPASSSYSTSGSWRGSSHRSSSQEKFNFETTLKGGLVLKVYEASITRLNVDAIVNAANDTMMHGGGVARVISEAAGYDLDRESNEYVDRRGRVRVSENIVTTAGRLPYKGVIHAVGPVWHDYSNKTDCLRALYDCVFKILTRCEQRKFGTVGMSAISAGIFAVPKELCADMYVKAAVDFSQKLGKGEYAFPRELHILDIDTSILDLVKKSVEKWQRNPSSIEIDDTLRKYLQNNPHVLSYPSYNSGHRHRGRRSRGHGTSQGEESGSYGRGDETNDDEMEDGSSSFKPKSELKRKGKEKFAWGGIAQVYDFEKQITVKIFKGDIDKSKKMRAIVCGTDKSLQSRGLIADALKKVGGNKFENSFKKMVGKYRNSAKELDVFKCEAGDLGVDNVIYIVMERVVYANAQEVSKYETAVKNILEKAREWEIKELVIPMFGTGTIQTSRKKLKKCCVAALKGIDSFLDDRGNKAKITDIHLVNNSQLVCEVLEEVFNEGAGILQGAVSGSSDGNRKSFNSGEDEGRAGSDVSQNRRGSDTRRTYTAAGLEKSPDSYSSNPNTEFSRSQDGRRDKFQSSGRHSNDLGIGQDGNGRKRSERGNEHKASPSGSDEESDHKNTGASAPQKPSKTGNLNIIET